jgi:pSer/pThr/pTyr-binding forkhead associated (FHA) protein
MFRPKSSAIIEVGTAELAIAKSPSGEPRPMQVVLEPVNGKGLKIPVDKAIVFIGRHPECDVVITRSRTISRKHCAIVQVNDSLVLRDLGSTNGVRVNGKLVKKEARFTAGDTVTFGDIEYNVRKVKLAEPEKRANRDHPQDARAGGAIPLRAEAAPLADDSQEVPIAIPEEEEVFEVDEASGDTPDSMVEISPESRGPNSIPVVSPRKAATRKRQDQPAARNPVSDDSSIPLAD